MPITAASEGRGPGAGAAAEPRAVRIWLFLLAALVIAMVGIGGATRLTGSGLSITEWKPVTGAIPPLSQEAWAAEFAKYRQIPQYQLLNSGMTLEDFKFIYWWEWGHRQLGRFLGLAFVLPLLWFWARGAVRGRLALALTGLAGLGGLQAAVGWIMVASGLQPGMVAVAPLKLMLHLTIASAIFAWLIWLAVGLRRDEPDPVSPALRWGARLLFGLVLAQVALGGLVAGSKAGLTYNTWPLMDGALVPPASALFVMTPWIENFVANVTLVQFNHRLLAYLLVVASIAHMILARQAAPGSAVARRATALAGLTTAQMALGIITLLLAVPLWAGLAHQLFAMAVLGMAAVHARLSSRVIRPLPAGALAAA